MKRVEVMGESNLEIFKYLVTDYLSELSLELNCSGLIINSFEYSCFPGKKFVKDEISNILKSIRNSGKAVILNCDRIIHEKEINLSISYYLKTYLENCGYNVVLTRSGDYDLASKGSNNRKKEDISKRVDIINNENTILFISIHCNIYSDESIRGAQTFYNSTYEENKILSNKIQNRLCNILKNTNRKEKSITDKYLIDKSIKTGCLIEVGFLSNKEEFNLLVNPAYQDKIAYSIYIGIMEFLGINNNF